VMELQDDDSAQINSANVHHFKDLWKDPGILRAFDNRSKFQLPDSAQYYFDRLDAIAAPGYIPTEQDILRSRVKTSGIVVNDFLVEGNEFKMIDVGGQRNERKKWIACFEGVTAVLFIGVLSEYDLVLSEDDSQNRMVETLTLFEEICKSPFFCENCHDFDVEQAGFFSRQNSNGASQCMSIVFRLHGAPYLRSWCAIDPGHIPRQS